MSMLPPHPRKFRLVVAFNDILESDNGSNTELPIPSKWEGARRGKPSPHTSPIDVYGASRGDVHTDWFVGDKSDLQIGPTCRRTKISAFGLRRQTLQWMDRPPLANRNIYAYEVPEPIVKWMYCGRLRPSVCLSVCCFVWMSMSVSYVFFLANLVITYMYEHTWRDRYVITSLQSSNCVITRNDSVLWRRLTIQQPTRTTRTAHLSPPR